MALRGDVVGGSHTGGGGVPGSIGVSGGSPTISIERYLRWNWAFFGGAVLTTSTAVVTMAYWTRHMTLAPATFFFEVFMLIFGIMMLVLDTPIPQMQSHKQIQAARSQIYKFALFMTRFMGRGLWYLFLATMVFGALWDNGINWFLGLICTSYLVVLGVAAVVKGLVMTRKLNRVHTCIRNQGFTADRLLPGGHTGLSGTQFKSLVEEVTKEQGVFTDDEVEYVINAIAFTPYHDSKVTVEELRYWLMPGPPMMV